MSAEENKKTLKRNGEDFWIKGNLLAADETMDENYVHDEGGSREDLKRRVTEHLANPDALKLVKIVFNEMVGEGDKLAVWQTNHWSDGKVTEIFSFHNFKNGRFLNTRGFMKASEEQE